MVFCQVPSGSHLWGWLPPSSASQRAVPGWHPASALSVVALDADELDSDVEELLPVGVVLALDPAPELALAMELLVRLTVELPVVALEEALGVELLAVEWAVELPAVEWAVGVDWAVDEDSPEDDRVDSEDVDRVEMLDSSLLRVEPELEACVSVTVDAPVVREKEAVVDVVWLVASGLCLELDSPPSSATTPPSESTTFGSSMPRSDAQPDARTSSGPATARPCFDAAVLRPLMNSKLSALPGAESTRVRVHARRRISCGARVDRTCPGRPARFPAVRPAVRASECRARRSGRSTCRSRSSPIPRCNP